MTDYQTEKTLARLAVRGVVVSRDADFIKMAPWTRLTFALCTAATAVATAFTWCTLLWAMVPIALVGAVMRRHPFDYIYNKVIRRFTGTIELPTNAAPTRFACAIASVWFVIMALAFQADLNMLGYVLGAMFVGVGALVSITHFCIPATIFQILFGDRRLIKPTITGRIAA